MNYAFGITSAAVLWALATAILVGVYYANQSKRVRLALLALRGNDYRHPPMGLQGVGYETINTERIDDPQTALLLRASDAERRFYALSILREQLMDDMDSGRFDMARDEVLREVDRVYWGAKDDAKRSVARRLEVERDMGDEFTDRVIVRDPRTRYKSVFAVPYHQDASIEHRADDVAEQILEEVVSA